MVYAGNSDADSEQLPLDTAVYAYLTITTGKLAGTNYTLDPEQENRLGRGSDCQVSVPDPMCSRVHAKIHYAGDGWVVRDAESRNGTNVNTAEGGRSHPGGWAQDSDRFL